MNRVPLQRRRTIATDTALLCVVILVAPQLLGGAFPWAVLVISGLCVVSLGAALWVRWSSANPVIDGVFIVMGVAWLWTCLQAAPLPSALAHALRLGSVDSVERLQGLEWADTVPFTISYDPGSTYVHVLIGVGILSSFLAARLGGPQGLKPIAVAIVGSATLLGLVGFAHLAAATDALFGIYVPKFTSTRVLAPLMNRNHLAGFCLMGALIAAGLASQDETRRGRISWIVVSVFCTVVVAWTLSRGAIGALLFGFLLLAAWLVRRSRGRAGNGKAAIPVAVTGAAVAGVVAFVSLEPILRRFETQGLDKLQLAAHGLRLLDGSVWWLGVGRGAFSSAFVAHEGALARATHPENLVVQWTTEWGVPVAMALLLVLVAALWKRFRAARDPIIATVCIAIFALSLQNLVDFSLEMAGVVVGVAALLGALLPTRRPAHASGSRKVLIASLGILAAALAILGPRVLGSDVVSIVDRLTRTMQADNDAKFEATLRRGLALHPSEPALALLAGTYAGAKQHPDAGRWLSIVMEEAPGWGDPHAVAARWLLASGRTDQALLEIREAEQRHAGRGHAVLCEVLERYPRMEHIERAAPAGDLRIPYLNDTARCAELPADLRAEIDSTILQSDPTHAWAVLREARRLTAAERSRDAIALLHRAIEDNPGIERLRLALVQTHLKAGDPEKARLVLEEAISVGSPSQTLLEAQARIEAALGQADAMRATLARVRGQARGRPDRVASSFILEGQLQASLGNVDEALAAYAAADAAKPDSPALQHAAALALRSGRPTQARRILRTLCARTPDGPACEQEARLSAEAGKAPVEAPAP